MRKRILSKFSFLAVVLLVLQLMLPFASASAATTSSILPPSNLAAQPLTPDDVKLTWSSVYGATGYNVYEIKEGQLILLGKVTTTSYNLNNLAEGSYSYVVSTLSAEGESGPSAPVSVNIVYPDMAAPSNLTYTLQNGNDIVLSWGASQYAEKYNVYQIAADGQKTLLTAVTARTYTISNAAAGQSTYSVSAVNSLYGESPLATPVQVEVVYPTMKAPGNFTYTVTNGSDVTLKWDAVPYATSYKIYEIINGQKNLKSTVTTTTVKFTNMPAGDYVYEVHSYSDRFGESADGSQISVTVSAITMAAPSNLTYKIQNLNDIVLTWGSVPYATSYKVYQIIDGQKVLKSTVTGTSVTYTKMPAGDYVFVVHSYSDRYGESAEGSQVYLTVEAVTMTAPTGFSYKIQNGNDIVLSWGSVSNATSYKVYQVVNGQKTLKSTVTGTTVTYTNMPQGDYTYEVRSYSDRFGESQDGNQLSFSLVHPTMLPPTNLIQTVLNATDFTLNWDASDYATSYKVYQIINGQKTLKSTVTGTSVKYTNMAPGEYTFVVHSYSSRFGESSEGTQLTFTLNGQTMSAPTNLTYTITNGNDITLKWASVQYATSYKIYQVVDGQKVLKSTVTGTSVTYTNLPGGTYNYVVHSVSSLLGESPEGAEISIDLVLPIMAAPGNLTYKFQNGNDVVLSWGAVQYATSYKVYEIVDGQKVLKNSVTSLSVILSKVPAGQHTYVVHSVSSRFGESPEGSQVTITMNEHTMEAPGNLTHSITNGNDITLRWDAVTYATAYKVYQIIDGQPVLKKTVTSTSAVFTNMPEGDYTYEVHSYSDRYGESPEGSQVSFGLVFPTMQAPGNLTQSITNGNDITLKWNAVTYATAYKVYQIIDGQPVLKKTVTSTSAAFTNMPEGNYTYEVHSYSDRFGESQEGSQVSLTLDFPTMQEPGNLTYSITNGNDITLRWNAATYATAYNVYQIIDGQKVLKKTLTGTAVTFTNMPEGNYSFEVTSYSDRFGESPKSSALNFTLTWPVVQPPKLAGTVFNANNITLSWQAVTWANEYRVYKVSGDSRQLLYKGTALSYNVYNLTEETHSFEVTAYSTRFGESAASNRVTETIVYPDMQPPVASLKLLSTTSAQITWNFVTYANGYNVYEIIDGKPVLLVRNLNNLSYTVQNLSYANHEYYVTSYSNSFGESEPSNTVIAKLIVDTEAPVTKANAPTDWTNQNPVVTLSATDNETGVANTYYSLNDSPFVAGTTFTINEEGVHKVSFYSVDKVGNIEATQTIYIKVDKTAPMTKVGETPAWSTQSVTLNLTTTDPLSGVAKTYYSINGSEYVEGTSFTVDKEGTNQVSFYSIDKAGNVEKVQTIEVKVDKTAPVTTPQAPEGWQKEDVVVTLTSTDGKSGVDKTFYSINGSEYVEGTSFTVDKEGTNQVSFYSIDKAGNVEKVQTIEVKVDKTAPVTTSNVNDKWSQKDVTVQLTAQDQLSGVAKTFYSIDGAEFVEGTSFIVTGEGVHKVSFYSVDHAGNIENVNTVDVKIDKTAPVASWNLADEYALKSALVLAYTAEDAVSGVASEELTLNGQVLAKGTTVTLSQPGEYQVKLVVTDNAGWSTTLEKTFVVYIPAEIKVEPKVIKDNDGKFTVKVTLPVEFQNEDFELASVTLNGVNAIDEKKGDAAKAEKGHFRFERNKFDWKEGEVKLEFRAKVGGKLVIGYSSVKVEKKK